jgi:hypothetical protein
VQKYFIKIFLIWVSKNAEFDVDFKSVEKVAKKIYAKKVRGLKTFVHITKR